MYVSKILQRYPNYVYSYVLQIIFFTYYIFLFINDELHVRLILSCFVFILQLLFINYTGHVFIILVSIITYNHLCSMSKDILVLPENFYYRVLFVITILLISIISILVLDTRILQTSFKSCKIFIYTELLAVCLLLLSVYRRFIDLKEINNIFVMCCAIYMVFALLCWSISVYFEYVIVYFVIFICNSTLSLLLLL